MNIDGQGRRASKSPNVPVSRRSSAARGYSANQRNSRAVSSHRSGSIDASDAADMKVSFQTHDLDDNQKRSGSYADSAIEDNFFTLFDELKDMTKVIKADLCKVIGMKAEERTETVRNGLIDHWEVFEQRQDAIELLMSEYKLGPRYHPQVNVKERQQRSE